MKKTLYLFLIAMLVLSCDDDCDHNVNPIIPQTSPIVGTWYEEEMNEEIRFSSSGTLYDKYCYTLNSFETEGRYELSSDARKLTYYYNYMGQSFVDDWTISNMDEFSFTITSTTVAAHILEKVIESYSMNVNETQTIAFPTKYQSYTVQSYTSKNERIASVSNEGIITTNGEKGTTYIKIETNNGNAWVKVVVGGEYNDLWFDYVSLIGKSYAQIRSVLGNPHQNDGDQGYFYALDIHDYLKQVSLWLNPRTRVMETMNLALKEGVPSEVILTYLEARYYKYAEIGKSVQFLNNTTIDNSIAIIEFNQEQKTIIINDIDSYINLWPDFTKTFGKDQKDTQKAADYMKLSFLMSSQSYSPYGSDYYEDEYGIYVNMYGFVYNELGQMFEYWAYLFDNVDLLTIANVLGDKYVYDENETTQGALVWFNSDRTIRVELNVAGNCIIYRDLTLEGLPKWPDYTASFGMTLDEIVATYGELFYGMPAYFLDNEYIDFVLFRISDKLGVTIAYQLKVKENISHDEIHQYLSEKYTLYKQDETGKQFAYCDGETRTESKLQIVYNTESGTIIYYDIELNEKEYSVSKR